ncbi:MAG: SpaA isopeptide-forming pilin-related protein [Hespellia sp.]|nr:SpaA isopeptide-forming pilin-related protein [Hespellia sp.]
MSKVKKILAVVLSMAMIMGMSITSFAADKATITIKNAGENATFQYVQVIKANPAKSPTGWEFTSSDIEGYYKAAFNDSDAQSVIKKLIDSTKGEGNYANAIKTALDSVLQNETLSTAVVSPIEVSEAGVYAIKGTETGYNYSSMAAYVSFDYNVDGSQNGVTNTSVEAKRVPTTVTKNADDKDKVVSVGRSEGFTIDGVVPYIPATDENKFYAFRDTITGATYDVEKEGTNAGKLAVKVTVGTEPEKTYYADVNGNSFVLNLISLINADNSNANQSITLKYNATVTDVHVHNEVIVGDGTSDGTPIYGSDSSDLYTGKITLTKKGEGTTVLANAGFNVTKGSDAALLKFTQDKDKNDADIAGSYTYDPNGEVTEIFTKADGTVVINGLDVGIYHFTEKTAPEGYSVNTKPADATLEVTGNDGVATGIIDATTSMADTKLSSLPSTGGIGTTIFTIGGCAIMIIAAFLYFRSRKKEQ